LYLNFLLFFAPFTLTRADYFMDDTNSSIKYTPEHRSWDFTSQTQQRTLSFTDGTPATINYSKVWNYTLAYSTSKHGQMLIPFTGSGITIYAVQLDAPINYTISLNGTQLPENFTTSPDEQDVEYNVTLYNNQSLPFAPYELVLRNTGTLFIFDSVYVNETMPTSASTTSTSPTPSSSSTPPSSSSKDVSHKSSHVGAIAGGTAGGFIALGVIGSAIVVFLRRRRRNQWAPSSKYSIHDAQPINFPPQSPLVPLMTQEKHHSVYGDGA